VAKGFRKPSSKGLSRTIFPYTEHQFCWQGRGDLKTLTRAHATQVPVFLQRECLFFGLYINEILYRLLHENDSYECLYQHYSDLMAQLISNGPDQVVLRRFEMLLLQELGYGLDLDAESEYGKSVVPSLLYQYIPEQGLVEIKDPSKSELRQGAILRGSDIMAIARGDFSQTTAVKAAKQLTRQVIDFYLDGRQLNSRELYRQHLSMAGTTGDNSLSTHQY
jgi:DNA repair protein RecO (recombination protein O)